MPVTLTNLQGQPFLLEQYPTIGAYIQGGHGTELDYYNQSSKTILPGEPLVVFNRLMISKDIILPQTFGTLLADCWISFLLDPAMVANILQGAIVYFDVGLAVVGSYIPGYATGVQPTNGFKLGYALGRHGKGAEIPLSAKSVIAAAAGSKRVFVQMDKITPTTFGTITSALTTA